MKYKHIIKKADYYLQKLIIILSFPVIIIGFILLVLSILMGFVHSTHPVIRMYKNQMSQPEIDKFFHHLIIYLKHATFIFYILLLSYYVFVN
jgi:hypothetical protein